MKMIVFIVLVISVAICLILSILTLSQLLHRKSISHVRNDVLNAWISAFMCGAGLVAAISLIYGVGGEPGVFAPKPNVITIEEQCEQNAICYELVETVAEYTDYTEQEIVDFFIIVSDDIDAWTAIHLLDGSLTGEQIDALLEISAMKQAE